jgi:uncharacterized UBP type Zn finger protein
VNLGSSCYINSVMQMLLAVPDFVQAYLIAERTFFNSMDPLKGQEDFNWQIIKLLHGMASGDYSKVGFPLLYSHVRSLTALSLSARLLQQRDTTFAVSSNRGAGSRRVLYCQAARRGGVHSVGKRGLAAV